MIAGRSLPRLIRKLQEALGDPICIALDDPSVVEVMLNPDGKLFIERLGHGIAAAGEMESGAAEIVIGSVAHVLDTEVDDSRPIVSAPSFTIRRRASQLIPLDDCVARRS